MTTKRKKILIVTIAILVFASLVTIYIFVVPLLREHQSVAVINANLIESSFTSDSSHSTTVMTTTTTMPNQRALATTL